MVLKTQPTARKKKNNSDVEFLDVYEVDDNGFFEGDIDTGRVLSTFNFGMSTDPSGEKVELGQMAVQPKSSETLILQNQPYSSAPRGLTPPIDGEHFTVKRTYAMRPSTVRKLNALKTEHPDINALFSTIVDMAITHYYNYIFNEKGTSETR